MEGLALSVESPVLLSPESRKRLQSARKNLRDSHVGSSSESLSRDLFDGGDADADDILERAYEEGSLHLRPEQAPLSFKLRKLWSERGAFSKFRASSLPVPEDDLEDSKGGLEKSADEYDLGVDLDGLVDEGADASQENHATTKVGETPNGLQAIKDKDVMSIQDMLQLRSRMLEKLGAAQHALYFSHALVSLLLNSTKADQGSASNPSVARAGSPNSASAGVGGAAAGLRGETAASTSVLQRSGVAANAMGSAAHLEAELGIEANVFGASRLEAERKDFEAEAGQDSTENADDDDEHDDGEENLSREARRQQKQDRLLSESERREKVETLVDAFQAKKQGLRGAADILRRGAAALRGDEVRNKSEKLRWQTLSQAKRGGWGLVADKPVRVTTGQKRELLEDGNRKRDEPARDAWIGYAVPEAHSAYRSRSLAFVSHDAKAAASSAEALSFASRPHKTLQVQFIHGDDIWTSGGDTSDGDNNTLNGQLSRAQCEMFDAELFDSIVGESRTMASSSSYVISFSDQDSVSLWLGDVELRIGLVEEEEERKSEKECSGLASGVRALLRLGLIRRYRSQVGANGKPQHAAAAAAASGKSSSIQESPLLLPIVGPIQYTLFLTRLQDVLERVTKADPGKEYELRGLEKIRDGWAWLSTLLQGSGEESSAEAVEMLGGSALIKSDGRLVALLNIAYPSHISLTMPAKVNALGDKGVHLSRVDLLTLESILLVELE